KGLEVAGIQGSGPGERIIERDVLAALASRQKLTPLAKSMVSKGEYVAPDQGSGMGGRITSKDLRPTVTESTPGASETQILPAVEDATIIPLKGTRKVIAKRMLASMQTTAQLT